MELFSIRIQRTFQLVSTFANGSARRDMLFPVQRYCLGGTFKYRYAI